MMLLHSFFFHFKSDFILPVGRHDGLIVGMLTSSRNVRVQDQASVSRMFRLFNGPVKLFCFPSRWGFPMF